MKMFMIFERESKLDRHFDVKFDGECDDEGLESYLDPLSGTY